MKSSVLVLIAAAVIGFSGVAYAGQAAKPAAMSDAEMDRVTAGTAGGNGVGGLGNGNPPGNNFGWERAEKVQASRTDSNGNNRP